MKLLRKFQTLFKMSLIGQCSSRPTYSAPFALVVNCVLCENIQNKTLARSLENIQVRQVELYDIKTYT